MSKENKDKPAPQELIPLGRGENIGLQGRLLMGKDFLDPNHEFKNDIKPEHLNITAETYKPLERLSALERNQFWKDKEAGDPKKQKEVWVQAVVEVVQGKKDYFESEEGKKRKELYGKLGINVDGFNQDSAMNMYSRFFAPDRKDHEVEKFAEDVLDLDIYKDPADENSLNFARVKEDLEAITWLGSIFGSGSSLIMTELIAAEARIHDKAQEQIFVKELNKKDKWFGRGQRRIDKLNEAEKGLLEYVNTADKKGELKVPEVLKEYIKIPELNIPDEILPPIPPVPDDLSEEDSKESSGLLGAASTFTRKVGTLIVDLDKRLQNNPIKRSGLIRSPRRKRKQPLGQS